MNRVLTFFWIWISYPTNSLEKYYLYNCSVFIYLRYEVRTAIDVIEDFENKRSASLNFLFRLSAFEFVVLLLDKYLSQPRIIFPYNCVSSRYEPSKA